MLGAYGTEDRSVLDIHKDLSTGTTTQLAAEVEFRERSNKSNNTNSNSTYNNQPGPSSTNTAASKIPAPGINKS